MVENAAEEKMKRARIKLFSKSPFFSYLSLYIKLKVDSKDNPILPQDAGMGVDIKGNLIIKEDFVNALDDDECMGVLCHEILHLSFLHLLRRGNRNPKRFNIAADLAVNYTLLANGFKLPKNGLIPSMSNDGEFKFVDENNKEYKIEQIGKKTAEQIYDELPHFKSQNRYVMVSGSGGGWKNKGEQFDEHIESDTGKEGKGQGEGKGGKEQQDKGLNLSEAEKNSLEREWLERLNGAFMNAKMRGNTPNGIERYIENLSKAKVNWRALLQRYLQASMPSDFTWLQRSKKGIASNNYLPSITKENVDVVVAIDASGSIGQKELTEFLSEIIGMARAYKDRISMTVLVHDTEVHGSFEVKNGSIEQIKKIKIKGGGGTEFKCIIDHINTKIKDTKCLIWLTDGYGTSVKDIPHGYLIIWTLTEGSDETIPKENPRDKIIKLEDFE